ncbi:hypothetical protein AB6A40_009143 [Gnathostoma spinigerum]|uniref:Glyoxylate reductase/hydroxypyruvate reductase n=1 Tax=Gnathostoma spinigerum TaxID=75299 RepID=A0ABD6EW69_9BILA
MESTRSDGSSDDRLRSDEMAEISAEGVSEISRTIRFKNRPSLLVTAKDVTLPRIYEKLNVAQYGRQKAMPRDLLLSEIGNFEGLYCLLRDKIDKKVLDAAKRLKVISTMSVGYDHIDIEECRKRNIVVTYTPDVLTETTAETTIALLLTTARRIPEAIEDVKTGRWGTWSPFYMCGVGICNSTVGIIGFGRIGRSVAEKVKAFSPKRVVFYDTHPDKEVKVETARRLRCESVTLEDLLRCSDFVILNCSATNENKDMINRRTLSMMRRNAVLINTSRGTLINQTDLCDALTEGVIRAAGLDVTTPEPLPISSPLLKLPNCVVFPHIGSATEATRREMMKLAEDCILAVLADGKMPSNARIV